MSWSVRSAGSRREGGKKEEEATKGGTKEASLDETEEPIVRPYREVKDIKAAVTVVGMAGGRLVK